MRGGIFPVNIRESEARAIVDAEPHMAGQDLVKEVSPTEMTEHGSGDGPLIAALDTGIKGSIVRNFVERGARLRLYPARTDAQVLLDSGADAIFLANGPGDPRRARRHRRHAPHGDRQEADVRHLPRPPAHEPCARPRDVQAAVRSSRRQPPGEGPRHRPRGDHLAEPRLRGRRPGGVRYLETNEPVRWETDLGTAELSHLNLYDRTVEGLTLLDVPGGTVQYHPEAGPGPNDALYLFDRFLEQINAAS